MSLHGSTLRFAASGTQLIEAGTACFGAATALVLAGMTAAGTETTIIGYRVDHPWPVVAAALVIAGGLLVQAVALARSGVVATPEGLALRENWRWRNLSWTEIVDLQAVDTSTERWATFFDGDEIGVRMRPVGAYSLGVIVTADRDAMVLPSCQSAARGEGLNMGGPTPTELKVAALRRYREQVVGEWPDSQRPLRFSDLHGKPRPALAVLWALAVPTALWSVLSLASDQPTTIGALVFWCIISLALTTWSQRKHLRRAIGREDR